MADRRITIQINADGTAAIRNIRDVTDETRRFGDAADSAGRRAADAFRGIAAAIGGAAVARAFLDANIAADRLEAGLTAVTGSSSAAAREMGYAESVAARLGLVANNTAASYLNLLAASRNTALEGQKTRDIFEAVGLAMAKLGKSTADTEGALLGLEQLLGQSTANLEDLRQITDRIPGGMALAAQGMGLTVEQMKAMISNGEILVKDIVPALTGELLKLYDDGSKISGLTAEWNQMITAFQGLAVAIDDAAGITYGLEVALRHTAEFIDNIRWAIEYLDKGVNPDRLAESLSAGDFGMENLRAEADRLYSEILAKQSEIYTLSEKVRESQQSWWSGSVTAQLNNDLTRAQSELLEYAQRLGDIKTAIAEMDQAQDKAWARQADGARAAAEAAKDYGEVLTGEAKIVADLEQQYGLLRGQLDAVWKMESGRGKTAGVDSSRMVQDLASAKGAVTEIVGEFQMARSTAQGLGADLSTFSGQAKAAAEYLSEAAAKGLTLWEQFAYYHGGPNRAAWGERTKAYADQAVKLVEQAGGAMVSLSRSTATAIEKSHDATARALDDAIARAEQLARQHIEGYAAAQDYAAAQQVLAVAVAAGAKSQEQATAILERMKAEMAGVPAQAQQSASAWQDAWRDAVQIVDDAFGNLWLDLFEGTSDALATMKRAIIQWLAQIAHMLTTQRLTLAIGASIGLPGYASAAGTAAGASGGGMGLGGMLSGIGGWFGSSSIGTSLGIGMAQSSLFNWVPTSGLTNLMAASNLAMFGGFGGGMLAGTLLGNGSQASQLGTTIGSAAGSVIGSMILPGIGTVLGGVLGGGGGGFLGKLFGGGKEKKPNPWAAIDVSGGQLRLLGSNEMDSGAIQQALDQVNREMDAVAQALGQAAVDWRRFYNHTSWHLTSGESIDSMIQNVVQWQITHMIEAMKNSEVARAGGVLMAEMIQQMVSEAGSDPMAAVAAVKMAKAMHRQLTEAVERLFVFSADAALFSSVDQAADSLWDLAMSMRDAGESTADALNRIVAAFGNLNLTERINSSLAGVTLDGELGSALMNQALAQKYGHLDQAVTAAEQALAAAERGTTRTERRWVPNQPMGRDYWGDNYGGYGEHIDNGGRWVFETVTERSQAEVDAARARLEAARKLAETTERILTEEEIALEVTRRRIEIMERITELAGGAESLAALQTQYYEMAFTEQERAQQAVEYALGKLADFNTSIGRSGGGAIDTIAELREYIEALDLSTDAGQAAYVQGLKQIEYFALLKDALETLNPEIEDLDQNLRGTLDTIRNALRASAQTMGVSEFERAMALRDLTRMASSSALPAQADLERTLGILNRVTDQDFRSAADRDLSRARTYASLLKLESIGERQIDPAAAAVTAMMDASAEQHTESLEEMQRQTAVLEQLNASLQSVPVDSRAAQSDQLVAELRALRADLATLTAQQILPARDTRDILRRWELDGLPSPRDESSETVGLLRVA